MPVNLIFRSESIKGIQTFAEKKWLKLEFQKPEKLLPKSWLILLKSRIPKAPALDFISPRKSLTSIMAVSGQRVMEKGKGVGLGFGVMTSQR